MDWVKQNLSLMVTGLVALALLGGAGYYFYSKMAKEKEISAQVDATLQTLTDYQNKEPFPNKKNLTQAEQNAQLLQAFMAKETQFFGDIPTNSSSYTSEFNSLLLNTLDQLKNRASEASVSLPTNFNFSFSAQRDLLQFDQTNLPLVTTQLADVKAICEVLYNAKVYALIAVRRAPVSTNDTAALSTQPQDYLANKKAVTNDTANAIILPYEVSFKCSTPELTAVLEGCATNRNGLLVQSVRVEPAEAESTEMEGGIYGPPAMGPMGAFGPMGVGGMMRQRYMGMAAGPYGRPPMAPAPTVQPSPVRPGSTGIILKEKPLRVALLIESIKLIQATQ
ncbi:MAG: Amuc_1100 family pilus-like protein [Candidatus Omnitrophica bacterium]|nr:Amuc_1100 family pilus-like protein [Candidatus Omnitrophota bacterium]